MCVNERPYVSTPHIYTYTCTSIHKYKHTYMKTYNVYMLNIKYEKIPSIYNMSIHAVDMRKDQILFQMKSYLQTFQILIFYEIVSIIDK